ncbi:hypothetical protein EDB84DRAFT_1514392 [Lactarius hengduanensis]|nr:hypothetical protein EDB84DRAFT_1514392 [Lactarius hengduanensis]
MSSRNKRSAESEEVSHKKKPRKDDDDDDVFDEDDSASDVDDDELEALDQTNVIETGRTRGIRLDYTNLKVPDRQDQEDDSGSETEAKGPKKKGQEKGQAATDPRIRSPERKPVTVIEEEKEDDGEEDGQDDDLGDEDDDDDDDGDDDDDDEL